MTLVGSDVTRRVVPQLSPVITEPVSGRSHVLESSDSWKSQLESCIVMQGCSVQSDSTESYNADLGYLGHI